MKLNLPAIVPAAKKRPLSYNPVTKRFIYYDEVEDGSAKIFPIEELSDEALLDLAIKRQLTNEPAQTAVLTGQVFSNQQVAEEIKKQSKIGKQLFNTDIEYLKFYLSQFPPESFEKK